MEKCSTWNIDAAAENGNLCVRNNRSNKSCSEQIHGKKDVFPFQMLYMNHCIGNMLFSVCRLSHQKSHFRTIA